MTTASPPSGPVPRPDADSRGHWSVRGDGRIALRRCTRCRRWAHPPVERCRVCAGGTRYEEVSGDGVLHTWTVVRRASVPGFAVPCVIGVVELVEQPAIRLSGIVQVADPGSLAPELAVHIRASRDGGAYAPLEINVAAAHRDQK